MTGSICISKLVYTFQVQKHGIGNRAVKRAYGADESDEGNESSRRGGHAYQNWNEE